MLPWKTIISIQKKSDLPVYLQIANSIIKEIKRGAVKPGTKMPGTRFLAGLISVHRKTMVNAYDELLAQDWFVVIPSKGTFVNQHLPETQAVKLPSKTKSTDYREVAGYKVKVNTMIHTPYPTRRNMTGFHDGPDTRLIPVAALTRAYRSVLQRKSSRSNLTYVDGEGKFQLRQVLSDYLNDTRGLNTTFENIFITRGSQMGIYMLTQVLTEPGDAVVVGDTSFTYADLVFQNRGAKLLRIPVDENGLNIDALAKACGKKKIRAVYITPHHHYPTTVTLTAARRMRLLALAEEYNFVILEDDYDFDFHYQSSPILPLASVDRRGMVTYFGTLSKNIAPSLRIGYVVAPKNVILEMSRLRQLIDVQGDPVMEQSVAELFQEGEIRRHMKKVLKIYHERRDFLCELLEEKLSHAIQFKVPDGGLVVWAKFDKKISLPNVSLAMRKDGVVISTGRIHDRADLKLNSTRMGFGWMNKKETERAVKVLVEAIKKT